MHGKLILLFLIVFTVLWVLVLVNSFDLPLYSDSLFTIGAGAKLADQGHFSSTFMLYGLVNPYILEALLNLKLGAQAPYILRLAQFVIAITGFIFLSRAVSLDKNGLSNRLSFFSTFAVIFSSTVILIESFEPTPETATLSIFSILFYLLVIYKPSMRNCVFIGLTLAFLAGTRPTSLILALPVFLVVPESFSSESYARRYWRWIVLLVISCASLLTAFPSLVSVTEIGLITIPLLFFVTLFSIIHDRKNGHGKVWSQFVLILAIFCVSVVVLFPNYFLHFHELIRQTNQYHIDIQFPRDSLGAMGESILYSFLYVTIAFPGPFAATGFYTAIGLFLSKRKNFTSRYRTLSLFVLGIVPFILILSRNEAFQSRYLIPVLGLFFAVASIGIRYLINSKLRYFLIIPFLISTLELFEVVKYNTHGGILNAFFDLSTEVQGEIQAQDVGPCHPHYYGENRDIYYPLLPYASSSLHTMNSENALYILSFQPPGTSFDVISTYGNEPSDRIRMVKESDCPGWVDLMYLTGRPRIWRGEGIVYLTTPSDTCLGNRD